LKLEITADPSSICLSIDYLRRIMCTDHQNAERTNIQAQNRFIASLFGVTV
jgi:hypothetical protein